MISIYHPTFNTQEIIFLLLWQQGFVFSDQSEIPEYYYNRSLHLPCWTVRAFFPLSHINSSNFSASSSDGNPSRLKIPFRADTHSLNLLFGCYLVAVQLIYVNSFFFIFMVDVTADMPIGNMMIYFSTTASIEAERYFEPVQREILSECPFGRDCRTYLGAER